MTQPNDTRLFAMAPDGTRLPVIDITHPAFATRYSDAEITELIGRSLRDEEARGPLQRLLIGVMLRLLARKSKLIGALRAADGTYLGGISTYVLKLGPDNLVPPYATEIDRQVVKSPLVGSMRLRLFEMATLLAETLAPRLTGNSAPLYLVEIAGGPSADGLNALLLLEQQGLLAGRQVRIVIFDVDTDGPAFAARMLEALQTGPLAGRDIVISHVAGSWSDTAALARILDGVPDDAVLAATSEGGLFEYGSDADIVGVLETLAPRAALVTGSVTRADRLNTLLRRHSRAATTPRGLDRFAALIAPTGYRIARSLPAPLSDQVLLTRS